MKIIIRNFFEKLNGSGSTDFKHIDNISHYHKNIQFITVSNFISDDDIIIDNDHELNYVKPKSVSRYEDKLIILGIWKIKYKT